MRAGGGESVWLAPESISSIIHRWISIALRVRACVRAFSTKNLLTDGQRECVVCCGVVYRVGLSVDVCRCVDAHTCGRPLAGWLAGRDVRKRSFVALSVCRLSVCVGGCVQACIVPVKSVGQLVSHAACVCAWRAGGDTSRCPSRRTGCFSLAVCLSDYLAAINPSWVCACVQVARS